MRLEARGITKTFGSNNVLEDAELVIRPGEIHALIGQNGSGKSTLVKVLTGYHAPDEGGSLRIDNTALALPVQWSQAQAAGISVVHQDLGLLDQLSVAENIGIGGYTAHRITRKIDWAAQRAVANSVLARLGLDVDPSTPVARLSASARAEVAIARALRDQQPGQGLVILDEATRSLAREELAAFHTLLRRVVADGTSVLMVSHNLDEVLSLSDKVTVLRDGRVAGAGVATADLDEAELARLMLGKSVDAATRRSAVPPPDAQAMVVTGLSGSGVEDLDLTVRAGEVVGLTGLPGSGFESVPYLITGAREASAGAIDVGDRRLRAAGLSVSTALRNGIALLPEGRIREGLALEMSLRDNIALPNLRRRGRPWHVARGWQDSDSHHYIDLLDITTTGPQALVKELSGGNQQKVLLGKWLSVQPDYLVLHEPTQAVDVGARREILTTIGEAADRGIGVLHVSIEPSDLVEVCDRILVFHPDRPLVELRTTDPDEVLDAIYTTAPDTSPATATAGDTHA
ncbi:sugar ABC transporter ATP-binding protein [Janibacter cremeus]|uniref:sugar ABC transporter ATP-binding protein n=1 Tax=Janibacter cremeus TaxID=1285192 RepID=UPI0023F83ABD|nr:sugar ABC transporter ATP-binding protein [Janibacter cremeus]WEV77395.1 sugar ABC transporter ATP-binding protein [Janibacter cremeus]